MRILVTFAVDAEFAPWSKLRPFREILLNESHWSEGVHVQEAQINNHIVWVYLTGMGIRTFDFRVASCLKAAGVDAVLSSGLAGSLNPKYEALSIVAPCRVGDLRNATGTSVSKALLELASNQGASLVHGLMTVNRVVDTAEEKARLSQFADVVDMESLHVVRQFDEEQIPVAVIRAISDGSEEEMPVDFEKVLTADGAIRVVPLLKDLMKEPGKIPALIRFGRQSRAAAEKLARFLDEYIQALTPELLKVHATEGISE
jgi:adenosylhomocysteine nucleosidase